jgi:hypothetical protein
VTHPWEYPWSSAAARVLGREDPLLCPEALAYLQRDWLPLLSAELEPSLLAALRLHSHTGRPLGSPEYLAKLEVQLACPLLPRKRGRKPKMEKANAG